MMLRCLTSQAKMTTRLWLRYLWHIWTSNMSLNVSQICYTKWTNLYDFTVGWICSTYFYHEFNYAIILATDKVEKILQLRVSFFFSPLLLDEHVALVTLRTDFCAYSRWKRLQWNRWEMFACSHDFYIM